MRKITITMFIIWLLLLGQPDSLFSDYTMMCTYFYNPVANVYNVNDNGDIDFRYSITVTKGGEPDAVVFSPNGHWGMVGCWTSDWLPSQWTTLLQIEYSGIIHVFDYIFNDCYWLVAISPDSKYGVYGADLKSLRYNYDGNYQIIPANNPIMANYEASFSSFNNQLYVGNSYKQIVECKLAEDGETTTTGFKLDISPSNGNEDIKVSPDGRTCIVLSAISYSITVLRIHEEGGFSLVEQFDPLTSTGGAEVDYTPDSKYAVITFILGDAMKIYRIESDSHLTEIDSISLPGWPGENMAITPDGKYAITRDLNSNGTSRFYVIHIHEDGTLEYLPENDYVCNGHVSAIAFVLPQITEANPSWNMYQ